MYKTERKAAARLLKVSIRTVDRYIDAEKLSIEKRDGRIWLSRKELMDYKRRNGVDSRNVDLSIDNGDRQGVDREAADVDFVSTSAAEFGASGRGKSASGVYKKLYEDTYLELKRAQERLEGANYRVGQLEAMVSKSVPLLEHQRMLGEEKAEKLALEEEMESLHDKIEKIIEKLKDEKISKKVYLIALFIILLLQPLWLIFIK
ncbi:hypothetical protein KKH03_02905 [Patescibacteria group bacterium]|nr:hypothetical protein [Patescibacteria group bacterium]